MNERIKELAELADDYADEYIQMPGEYHPDWNTVRDIRFAELIIRECSKVIINGGYRNPAFGDRYPITPPEIAKMIEEHFGVE